VKLAARVRRVAALTPPEWRVLADGAIAAARIELGLRTRPLGSVIAWAESRPAARLPGAVAAQRLSVLSSWPYRALGCMPSCLRRSLVLTALLRQRGHPAVLCVGVRREGAHIRAHAWVECGGAAFDATTEPFERLDPPVAGRISRSARWSP
jgi:Transglutaminase-like superfamily